MKKLVVGIFTIFALLSLANGAENMKESMMQPIQKPVVGKKEINKSNDMSMQTNMNDEIIPNNPNLTRPNIITISGVGEGVAPMDAQSPAQARLLAKETAMAVAYKRLAAKMYGIRLSAKDKIKDLMTQSSEIRTSVYGLIRGATIDEESWKNGIYTVVLVVKLNACVWSKYLTATPYYKCGK